MSIITRQLQHYIRTNKQKSTLVTETIINKIRPTIHMKEQVNLYYLNAQFDIKTKQLHLGLASQGTDFMYEYRNTTLRSTVPQE